MGVAPGLTGSETQCNAWRQGTVASLGHGGLAFFKSFEATEGPFGGAKLPVSQS